MRKSLILGLGIVTMAHLPFFLLGTESYITLHDNLDSDFIYLHLLQSTSNLFSGSEGIVPNVFNGLSTSYFHSEHSFIRVLFYLFPSFWAYVVNSLIISLLGFLGVWLLYRDYFHLPSRPYFLPLFVAIGFSLLPVYSLYGLSVLGQPILLWAFLRLVHKSRPTLSYIIIGLFPFYTHFAMTAPFVLAALFIVGITYSIRGQNSYHYWLGLVVLFTLFIVANFNSITGFLTNIEPNHRADWTNNTPSFQEVLDTFFKTLVFGQYHSSILFLIPLFILTLYAIVKTTIQRKMLVLLSSVILLIAGFNAAYTWIKAALEQELFILTSFQFSRFTFLLPTLAILLLLYATKDKKISNRWLFITLLLCSGFTLVKNRELRINLARLVSPALVQHESSYRSFYSTDLFAQIDQHIAKPKSTYRVVSLGIEPSIALYNGFYTLDAYQNNYPLAYKKRFRPIIARELDKNAWLKDFFDTWGSRCYLVSSELQSTCFTRCYKDSDVEINELSIDIDALKDLGGEFIFSGVPIKNFEDLNLTYHKSFEDNISNFRIHLYQL